MRARCSSEGHRPSAYGDPVEEYWALVNDVTLWDVAVERIVEITGPDASVFTNLLTCRDLTRCEVGQGKYVLVTAEDGGIVNDPVLLRIEPDRWWLALADSDAGLYAMGVAVHSGMDVTVGHPEVYPVQVQGPKAKDVMRDLFGDRILDMRYYRCEQTDLDGIPVVISRTGWTAVVGYEIYLRDPSRGDDLWGRILDAGKPFGIRVTPSSDIRRIEAGIFDWGSDFGLETNPFEVTGLERLVEEQRPTTSARRRSSGSGARACRGSSSGSSSTATRWSSRRSTGRRSSTASASGTSRMPAGHLAWRRTSDTCGCRSGWHRRGTVWTFRPTTASAPARRPRSRSSTRRRRCPRPEDREGPRTSPGSSRSLTLLRASGVIGMTSRRLSLASGALQRTSGVFGPVADLGIGKDVLRVLVRPFPCHGLPFGCRPERPYFVDAACGCAVPNRCARRSSASASSLSCPLVRRSRRTRRTIASHADVTAMRAALTLKMVRRCFDGRRATVPSPMSRNREGKVATFASTPRLGGSNG